jgi:hypothetical protein
MRQILLLTSENDDVPYFAASTMLLYFGYCTADQTEAIENEQTGTVRDPRATVPERQRHYIILKKRESVVS